MGTAQRTVLQELRDGPPHMHRLRVTGLQGTRPAPDEAGVVRVTDSAAAATAMACGVKTLNGRLGMDAEGREARTLLEAARAAGLAAGLVATSAVTHATPAAFAAHEKDRGSHDAIADDYLDSRPELILGGGRDRFLPKERGGKRGDGRDLAAEFRAAGYQVIGDPAGLARADRLPLLGLFAADGLTAEIDRDPAREPSLAAMTRKALDLLAGDPDGFFLMVEGSQIDWACHDNDPGALAAELLAFDEAIGAGIEFQARSPSTLLVVTADHETGGLAVGRDYRFHPDALRRIRASSERIARRIAEEPGSAERVMRELGGCDSLSAAERDALAAAARPAEEVKRILNERAGLRWNSDEHSGELILVNAQGPAEERFCGCYENSELAARMAAALGLALR